MTRRDLDHSTACLLGGALGDALGAPLEFLSLTEIRHRFGPAGLTDFQPAYGLLGAITDDTQMTLFTAEGLIHAYDRGQERGIWHPPSMIHLAYLRWLATQGETSRHPLFDACPAQGLAAIAALQSRRGPGATCLSALRSDRLGTRGEPLNDSKGCGGIMRIAPIGIAFAKPFEMACDIAALTHGHPSGYFAAGAFAEIIASLLDGLELDAAVEGSVQLLRPHPGAQETLQALCDARDNAEFGRPCAAVVESLGEGWVAEEALAISVYCAFVAKDFAHGVRLAANHSGDSDSTAALTGNLLGALWGRSALPPEWVNKVELRDEIVRLAQELWARYEKPL